MPGFINKETKKKKKKEKEKYTAWTIRMVKSRPSQDQPERSYLPCHIIVKYNINITYVKCEKKERIKVGSSQLLCNCGV